MKELLFTVCKKNTPICNVYRDESSNKGFVCEELPDFNRQDAVATPKFYETLDEYYRTRIFPENRVDKKRLLKILGLREYIPEEVCRATKGYFFDEPFWVRFVGDTSKYEDFCLR